MKVALLALTLVNIALTCLGAMTAVMSPMMFDSGGDGRQSQVGDILEHPVFSRRRLGLRIPALAVRMAQMAARRPGRVRHPGDLRRHRFRAHVRDGRHASLANGGRIPEPWRTTTCDRVGSTSSRTRTNQLPR
jgi:hypothetical protein